MTTETYPLAPRLRERAQGWLQRLSRWVEKGNVFHTTRWSLILTARNDLRERRAALDELCRAYRAPVLAYVRRHVSTSDEAEDLTQAFFLKFLEHRYDADADPARGRFRVFLLATVKHFLANAHDHANAVKRGGRAQRVEFDEIDPTLQGLSGESPERTFERVWALTVLERAFDRLRQESIDSGKREIFERLKEFLIESPEPAQYETIAAELGMRRQTLAMTVSRLRERLRACVRAELAETVSDAKTVDAELATLHKVLGAS